MSEMTDTGDANEVHLRGRLADGVAVRELPSGDIMATFRVTVRRPPDERGTVDSIDCVSTRARVRRTVEAACVGEELDIVGSLRRRFWRGPAGPQSRYAVDVTGLRRIKPVRSGTTSVRARAAAASTARQADPITRPDRPAGASRARKPASA